MNLKLKTKFHELKITPKYFRYVKWGIKKFELRKNDRGYEVGDYVKLREYNGESYSGEFLWIKITYILDFEEGKEFGLSPGYCILGFKIKRRWKNYEMGRIKWLTISKQRSGSTKTQRITLKDICLKVQFWRGAIHTEKTVGQKSIKRLNLFGF